MLNKRSNRTGMFIAMLIASCILLGCKSGGSSKVAANQRDREPMSPDTKSEIFKKPRRDLGTIPDSEPESELTSAEKDLDVDEVDRVRPKSTSHIFQTSASMAPDAEDLLSNQPLSMTQRLDIPKELPGADAPPLRIPDKKDVALIVREKRINALFPTFADPEYFDVPLDGEALSLKDLEEIALTNSPIVPQYVSDVGAAAGLAVQAGTAPNPIVGYESDTVGSSQNRDYHGLFVQQEIKTGGKLRLAQSIENVGLMNAQLQLQETRFDLRSKVRGLYFAVLVAQENLKVSRAIAKFTHEVYRVQVQQLKEGQATGYEPVQLRTFVIQSRSNFVQAKNRYISAWKQLTATLNTPDMAPVRLQGNVTSPIPAIDYEAALEYVLTNHTDVRQARNGQTRAKLVLELANKTPIPNLTVYAAFFKDSTFPAVPRTTTNVQVGAPLPLFDQNKGNIMAAQNYLVRATQEITKVNNDLRAVLSDAYERYENNRVLVEYYRTILMPDQARTYRGVYSRHQAEHLVVGFSDVIVAQQNLLNSITTYFSALGAQWTAVADVAHVMQLTSLDEMSIDLSKEPETDSPSSSNDHGDSESVSKQISRILFSDEDAP